MIENIYREDTRMGKDRKPPKLVGQLIRCKACKYCIKDLDLGALICTKCARDEVVTPEDYCSLGVKK